MAINVTYKVVLDDNLPRATHLWMYLHGRAVEIESIHYHGVAEQLAATAAAQREWRGSVGARGLRYEYN